MKKKTVLFCYAFYFAAYIVLSFFTFFYDAIGFSTGRLYTQRLTVEDFSLVDLEFDKSGRLISYGNDPQLIYTDNTQEIRSVSYTLAQPAKGDVALYYAKSVADDFSKKRLVLSAFGETQSLSYALPLKGVHKVRLDIGSFANEEFTFTDGILINPKRSFFSYFSFGISAFAKFLILPLLASCIIIYAFDTAGYYIALIKEHSGKRQL